jgi:hypothetical protein
LLVGARLRLLTLRDARLPLRGAALSLRVIEQSPLVIQLLQARAPLRAYACQTARHGKALCALALARACARLDGRALALDARPLRGRVVGCRKGSVAKQQRHARELK